MLNVEYKNVIKKYVLKEKKLLSFIFIVSIVSSVLALMTPRITQEAAVEVATGRGIVRRKLSVRLPSMSGNVKHIGERRTSSS